MTTYYLINRTKLGVRVYNPASLIDSAQDDVSAIQSAGGSLVLSSDATVAAAAAIAGPLALRGQHQDAAFIMSCAAAASARAVASAGKAKADLAPAFQAVAAGAMVAGTLTIATGLVIATASEVIPLLRGAVTGSTNFGSLRELVSGRVNGASGTGQVVIEAVGSDGAKDADAAVAAGLIHVVVLTAQ